MYVYDILHSKVLYDNLDIHYISTLKSLSPYRQETSPFTMLFLTCRPNSPDDCFTYLSLEPDNALLSILNKEELAYIANPHMHQHNFYEIGFVLEGSLYQQIENIRHLYCDGSCYMLNRNTRHFEEFFTEFKVVLVDLAKETLIDILNDTFYYFQIEQHISNILVDFIQNDLNENSNLSKHYIDFIPKQPYTQAQKHLHDIFAKMAMEIISPKIGSSLILKSLCLNLFSTLSSSDIYDTNTMLIGTQAEGNLFNRINHCIRESHGHITRKELEQQFNYSGDYINKIIKKFTGKSIFNYGMTICMDEASTLLIQTNLKISEIASMLGFNNRTHFYNIFRKTYGITPLQYRKNASKT